MINLLFLNQKFIHRKVGLVLFFFCCSLKPAATQTIPEWLSRAVDQSYPVTKRTALQISRLTITRQVKHDLGRIENTGVQYLMDFDSLGRLVQMVETSMDADSIITFHHYTQAQRHIARTFNGKSITTLYENFDQQGRLITAKQCRETNLTNDIRCFKPGMQELIYQDSIGYEILNEEQTKKRYFNNYRLPYLEGIQHQDKRGKIIQEFFKYSATGVRAETFYTFNADGTMIEMNYFTDASGDLNEKYKWIYDKNLITEEQYFRNGTLRIQRHFFYDSNNQLESILAKPTKGYTIDIYNFKVEFKKT